MSKIALFDMDGTLFDYEKQLRLDFLKLSSKLEREHFEFDNKTIWEIEKIDDCYKERISLIKTQDDWWANLPKMKSGWKLLKIAQEIGFEIKILTKGPFKNSKAWKEKVDCVNNCFGENITIDIVGKNKSGCYGRVLVDDYPDYVSGWLKYRPRGLAILPSHDYNRNFKHPNAIIYNGKNVKEIKKSLKKAYARNSNEHWM